MSIPCGTTWLWTVCILYCFVKPASSLTSGGIISGMQESIHSARHRQVRDLSYPEESEMGLFFALAIPLDDPVSTKAVSVAFFFEANYQLPNSETENETKTEEEKEEDKNEEIRRKRWMNPKRRPIDRRTIYSMLESKFESIGFPGRACVSRSICETARNPLNLHNGLLGDLFRILFTPSSSADEGLPNEYMDAENQLDTADNCGTTYSLCPFSIYDYITTEYE